MICAIILAAGQSRRMGAQKLLLPFRGGTVIGRIAGEVLRSPVARTFVVLGADGARVAAALAGLPLAFVTNPDPAGDMLSSVRCGLRALPPECQAVLLALGDQPSITAGLIAEMVNASNRPGSPERAGMGAIVVPVYHGKRGHPLLFSACYSQEVLTRYDGEGLHGLLLAHPDEVVELPAADDSVLSDMDYPQDYLRLQP
jgi:molybdenum cofactor cytidylyltransferase